MQSAHSNSYIHILIPSTVLYSYSTKTILLVYSILWRLKENWRTGLGCINKPPKPCCKYESCCKSYAVLESVVVFRVTSRAVAEIVVPLGFAEASFFSRRPVVLGVVAAAE